MQDALKKAMMDAARKTGHGKKASVEDVEYLLSQRDRILNILSHRMAKLTYKGRAAAVTEGSNAYGWRAKFDALVKYLREHHEYPKYNHQGNKSLNLLCSWLTRSAKGKAEWSLERDPDSCTGENG